MHWRASNYQTNKVKIRNIKELRGKNNKKKERNQLMILYKWLTCPYVQGTLHLRPPSAWAPSLLLLLPIPNTFDAWGGLRKVPKYINKHGEITPRHYYLEKLGKVGESNTLPERIHLSPWWPHELRASFDKMIIRLGWKKESEYIFPKEREGCEISLSSAR